MATYIMIGKYSIDSIGKISQTRTKSAKAIISDSGGELRSGFAMLGDKDLLLIVEYPNIEKAMKASTTLSKELGIAFNTSPALSIEDFDKLNGGK